MDRTKLWPKKNTYLATLDIVPDELCTQGGVAAEEETRFRRSWGTREGKPASSLLYNALGESRVLGQKALQGKVIACQERLRLRPLFEMGELEGRWIIETDEGASLWCTYKGVLRAGPRWPGVMRGRKLDSASPALGELTQELAQQGAVQVNAFVVLRFETGLAKYQWLVEKQCTGYGQLALWEGKPVSMTYDFYALT